MLNIMTTRALLLVCLAGACVRAAPDSATRAPEPRAPAPEVEHDLTLPEVASADRCPDAAENLNGIEDDDGCPETLPADLAAITGVIAGLRFTPNKDQITGGREQLTAIAAVLQRYPAVRVEVQGHIPVYPGEAYHRVDLSSRRAQAIHRFLLTQGVDAARLSFKGFGSDVPVDTNKTAAGRMRNNRIELVILPRSP